jgi:hypothetical protein
VTAPYAVGFIGEGITRLVPLALPSVKVRAWLPDGLELGEQNFTLPGTHPVIFLFQEFSHCQFSFPTLLRSMNYHEQSVGVPFTHIQKGVAGSLGPYYFMPRMCLDDLWVLVGSVGWGFNKELARVNMTAGSYTVTSLAGRRLASLAWTGENNHRAVRGYTEFEPIRQILSQRLVTAFPAHGGPFFALTDFNRRWEMAKVRPVRAILEIDPSYMQGFNAVRYPASGWSEGIESSALGSYELLAPWWLSFPYPPLLPFRDHRTSQANSFLQHR